MNIFIVWSARPSTAAAVAITTPAASPRRASVNPGARPANERVSAAALAQPRVRDAVAQLMVRVVHISLDEATRAHFLAQMTDAAATKRGRTVRADALLADVVDDVPGLVDAVLAGRVPGFTAPALRFTVELATSLAEHQEVRVQREQERATAVSRKDLSVAEVLACRTELVQRTRDVLPGDAPERAALQRAAKLPSRKLDGALAAVEATLGVVEAVFTRAEGDATYGAYLTAMGFTRASLGAVTAPVRPALEARSSHREAYTAGGVAQQEVDGAREVDVRPDEVPVGGARVVPLARLQDGVAADDPVGDARRRRLLHHELKRRPEGRVDHRPLRPGAVAKLLDHHHVGPQRLEDADARRLVGLQVAAREVGRGDAEVQPRRHPRVGSACDTARRRGVGGVVGDIGRRVVRGVQRVVRGVGRDVGRRIGRGVGGVGGVGVGGCVGGALGRDGGVARRGDGRPGARGEEDGGEREREEGASGGHEDRRRS